MKRVKEQKTEPWDLTEDGQKNISRELLDKLLCASTMMESRERTRTIINIDDYENAVLILALREYAKKRSWTL